MLIHATVTITGDQSLLGACEARLRRLLSTQFLKDEVTEHHGGKALCYDLKVEGGIPFPAFAQASHEFPGLNFGAEWVDVTAGERGAATIVNGHVSRQQAERIAARAGSVHPVYVKVAEGGRLELALTLFRAGTDEWRGYALTATRDALVHVQRKPGSETFELYATQGAPEWAVRWRGTLSSRALIRDKLPVPIGIDEAAFRELDALARGFVADWIWFAAGREEDIAIEKERFQRYGYTVHDANVRGIWLHRMRGDAAGRAGQLEHATLGSDDLWIKDLLLAAWAEDRES